MKKENKKMDNTKYKIYFVPEVFFSSKLAEHEEENGEQEI